ncbi:MAG: type I secretion system permease/ATPase [Roseibium sp.]
MNPTHSPNKSPISKVFSSVRSGFLGGAGISLVINVLMLTGPLFMLQVYDRVLASGSVPTLVAIGGLAVVLYGFYGILEGVRGRILLRLGLQVDAMLSEETYRWSNSLPVRLGRKGAALSPIRDLDTIRQFLAGAGPAAFFDLPWLPLYLGIVFLFHPLLGFVGLGGAVVIFVLILLNEVMSRAPVAESNREAASRSANVEIGQRNSEAIAAMGMQPALSSNWTARNADYLATLLRSTDRSGLFGTIIKTVRFVLQSAVLGVGAWLAIQQEITPGVMIAASIMTSRALAPIEQAVAQWRGFVGFRQALKRLREGLAVAQRDDEQKLDLPLPKKQLDLEAVFCGPYGEATPFVQGITLSLEAGDGLGIIGPSGSGKSTLARALVGALAPLKGHVRFDGAEIGQWDDDRRGAFVGYLPQDLQLFDGTIADNIARFRQDVEADTVIEAAKRADVHDLIVSLPDGYNTLIGRGGRNLSAGQRQRIALARALYGNPFLIVLDEPNSNLDSVGEAALTNSIKVMRDHGSIVVVIAHRPSAIATVNKILCLKDGKQTAFGPKDEVLKQVLTPAQTPPPGPVQVPIPSLQGGVA